MAGYSSLGKDFPFADEVNPEDGACHAERRDVDKATTSLDSNICDNIEEVWNKLELKVRDDRNTVYKKDAAKQVDILILQYALKSKVAKPDLLARIGGGYEFEVESPGVVHVSGECFDKNKIDELWVKLISSINDALTQRNVVTSYKFRSRTELENTLQKLDSNTKRLTETGIIGIFTSYEDNVCIAKFVAAQPDLEKFRQELHLSMASGNNATIGHLKKVQEYHKENEFIDSIDISDDEDKYFQTMDYLDHLRGKFPHVRITREDTDSATYKFICVDEHELMEAMSWFHSCINEMERKMVDVSPDGFKFISKNNVVQAYLEIKLQKVQSALMISSDKIYVLCQKRHLETSEKIVVDNIKTVALEGSLIPEAEEILKNCHGKIQVFKVNKPGIMIIYYTVDKSVDAEKLINLVQKYRKYMRKPYSDKQIKVLKALGVIKELQEEYKDILIRTEDGDVILQGPEMDGVDACFEKLDTVLQQIKFVKLNTLPELQQKLLKNGKVQTYVTEKLKGKIAFCEVGKTVTGFFIRENENSKSNIYLEIKSCFVEMKIDTRCLEHGKGKSFLSEHPEEVVIGDQGNKISCIICCTADLSQEMEQLLYSYSKSCTGIVANCLQLFGDEYCKELEKQNNIGIEVENDRICVKGPYNRAKSVITEIESHVNTTVLHFGKLDYQRNMLFAADKNKIDSIARSCKCCWKADVFRYEPTELEEKGIDYLCTWNLPRSKEQVSIAKIDYNTVKLDVLIIPVNQCLWGEDINGKGIRMYDVHNTQSTQKLGYSEELVLTEKYPCNKYVGLVTSEVGQFEKIQITQLIKSKDLQKSCASIFGKMFRNGLFRIGFALPTSDTNLVGKLEAIIDGFQDITQFYDNMPDSKLIFGVKTEAERWMQEVDYISTLKFAPYVRRNISPRYKGLFSSPSLSVQIQKKSILETGAHCIVVAISWDLDLSRGIVSKLVSEACGEQLQKELHSKDLKRLDPWELVMCQSYNLSKNGIQKVIFGFIPEWEHCQKIEDLELFIEDCLLLADSAGCSTVAFPALGTGNLGYPLRDVAVALFNGVDRYATEGTIGGISTVYISVPKTEDSIHQIFEREQQRRKSAEHFSGKQLQADDQEYLVAENGSVKYSIITDSVCDRTASGKFVNIKFESGKAKSKMYFSKSWELKVRCAETREDLKESVERVTSVCEEQKITSVNIFCLNGKKLSEADQVDIIIQSVEEAVTLLDQETYPPKYEYLKNVRIVVSDAAFPTVCEMKRSNENVPSNRITSFMRSFSFKGNAQISLDWKTTSYHSPKTTQCLNVTLAGCKHSDLERAKVDITQYIEGIEYCDIDPDMILDLVSAELNPGIAKHLVHRDPNEFEKWRKELSKFFNVYFWINKDIPKIEIWGSFGSILQTEQYFENEFPMSPLKSEIGLLETHDQHYQPEFVQEAYQKSKLINEQVKCMEVSIEIEKATYKFKKLKMTVLCHDITDIEVDCIVSPVNKVVSTDTGVAKYIAVKAGRKYKGQCKAIGHERSLDITECVVTGAGQLQKCKYVIHVHSPQSSEANRMPEQLLEIEKSVTNCLKKADELRMTTIAIPFLGTGTSKFPIDHCGIQYYRAVDAFKDAETLKKVILVDIMQNKVIKVCTEISKCTSKSTNFLLDAVLAVKTSKSCVRYHFAHKQMNEVDTDAVVMKVDKNLNGHGEDMELILARKTQRFQDVYQEQSKISHVCTNVVPIQADLKGLQWKYVFFAVIPVLKDDPENFEHCLNITVQHILQYASERDISDITLPILSCEDDPTSLDLCCKAMVSSVLRFGHQTKRKLERIQFLSRDSKALTTLMLAMLEQLENGKIKVAY